MRYTDIPSRNNSLFPFCFFDGVDIGEEKQKPVFSWHEELELVYCMFEGNAEIDGVTYAVSKEDILLINPRQLHTLQAYGSGNMWVLRVNLETLGVSADEISGTSGLLFPNHIGQRNSIYQPVCGCMQEIAGLMRGELPGKHLQLKSLLYHMMYLFYTNGKLESHADNKKGQTGFVQKTLLYMKKNIDQQITIDDLAKNVHFSSYHFIKAFKRYMQLSPMEYLQKIRLNYAVNYLAEGKSITDTAYLCGFNNISYFIRVFKRHYNMTPKAYQNQLTPVCAPSAVNQE